MINHNPFVVLRCATRFHSFHTTTHKHLHSNPRSWTGLRLKITFASLLSFASYCLHGIFHLQTATCWMRAFQCTMGLESYLRRQKCFCQVLSFLFFFIIVKWLRSIKCGLSKNLLINYSLYNIRMFYKVIANLQK